MRASRDHDAYAANPYGAFASVDGTGIVFCARKTGPWGFALWGRPTATSLRRMVRLLAIELREDTAPHASLVDLRRLEAGDPRAFAVVTTYLRDNFEAFRTQVTRLALVRPPGLLGATIAGFFEIAGAPYPVRVFADLAAAAAWVDGGALIDLLDRDHGAAPAVILALARWLDANPDGATLAAAAKAVGRATRSLQRDLRMFKTSFARERNLARLRLAKQLLVETDSPLTEIAYDVGCASPQHFSAWFRSATAKTPTEFRRNADAASRPKPTRRAAKNPSVATSRRRGGS